jgi:hypothetical protein
MNSTQKTEKKNHLVTFGFLFLVICARNWANDVLLLTTETVELV